MAVGVSGTSAGLVKDLDWIAQSFMLAGERVELSKTLVRFRNLSSADFKFVGTGFGQSTVLNPAPQFTPFADIRKAGILHGGKSKSKEANSRFFVGLGRAYSEMIDDNRQVVHIRFGITQFKGLISFFTGFYDNGTAMLARRGRASLTYYFSNIVTSIATLWLQPIILAGQGLKYILGRTSSRYMDIKPVMPLYWERVQVIMNNIGAQLGIIPRLWSNTGGIESGVKGATQAVGGGAPAYASTQGNVKNGGIADAEDLRENQETEDYKTFMHRLMPDIFRSDGTLDVQNAVLNGARLALAYNNQVSSILQSSGSTNSQQSYLALIDAITKPLVVNPSDKMSIEKYLEIYHKSVMGSLTDKGLDGDVVGDKIEELARNGDQAGLKELASRQPAGESDTTGTAGDTTQNATADVSGTPTTTTTNSSFVAATGGTVQQPQSATQASQTDPAAETVAGIDSNALHGALFTQPSQEMRSVVRPRANSTLTENETNELRKSIAEGSATNVLDKVYQFVHGWLDQAGDVFALEWANGSAFLNLGVNYTGAGTMSIANATKETTISGTIKGISGAARDSRVSMSDFQTGFGFLDGAIKMVGDVFAGALDAVSMGGLMALGGNAFTDFPKQWDDSTATVPTANFTIELRSFTGNKIADYLYLYTVVAALLAGATPLATGSASYTSPFVCEAYCQGHFAIRYGMITNITIRHGVGNLGYNVADKRPLAFDIDVEIADFSSVYYATISNGMSPLNAFKRVFDDDNIFNDYISTITGLTLDDMVNPKRKLAIRMATQLKNIQSWWSPTHIASRAAGTAPVQVLNKLFGPTVFPNT